MNGESKPIRTRTNHSSPLNSYLLSKGADPKKEDKNGVTPIDLASKAPNGIRIAFGLPPITEGSNSRLFEEQSQLSKMHLLTLQYLPTDQNQSETKSILGSSTAFIPLEPAPLPLAPLPGTRTPFYAY